MLSPTAHNVGSLILRLMLIVLHALKFSRSYIPTQFDLFLRLLPTLYLLIPNRFLV